MINGKEKSSFVFLQSEIYFEVIVLYILQGKKTHIQFKYRDKCFRRDSKEIQLNRPIVAVWLKPCLHILSIYVVSRQCHAKVAKIADTSTQCALSLFSLCCRAETSPLYIFTCCVLFSFENVRPT